MTRTNLARIKWFARFEDAVLAIDPALAGRINWDFAAYLFSVGRSPTHAASTFTARRA